MIKIVKSYLPTETIIITEHIKNEIRNKVIIDIKSRVITINGYKHTQLYYNSDDIKVYAKILIDRINEHKTKIFTE